MYKKHSCIKGINGFLIFFVLAQLISCVVSSRFSEDNPIIEMEKTPCYGYCPVYTLKIDQTGKGIFEGVENTNFVGLFTFRLRKEEIAGLRSAFEQAGFFELKDRYYKNVTDLPTIYLSYKFEGREKKIMDYYGAPQELKDLEERIEALVLSKKMKKIE
jgi:hypothetical protein